MTFQIHSVLIAGLRQERQNTGFKMALENYVGYDRVKSFSGENDEDLFKDLDDAYSNVEFQTKICLPPFSHVSYSLIISAVSHDVTPSSQVSNWRVLE